MDRDPKAERLGDLVEASGLTVAVAESLTGGELSCKLATARGSGGWFRGGVVAYSREVKHRVLGVPAGPVVSEAAVVAMAEGVRELLDADVVVAVSGVAGPAPQDDEPPGTVWMALHAAGTTTARQERFPGSPAEVVAATVAAALAWLEDVFDRVPGAR